MKNISFYKTQTQMKAKTKTETRRLGWLNAKPGDIMRAIEKGQGLKKGEKVKTLGYIVVQYVRREPLNVIDQEGVDQEGFPEMNPDQFVNFFCENMNCQPDQIVTVIGFKHLADETAVADHRAAVGCPTPPKRAILLDGGSIVVMPIFSPGGGFLGYVGADFENDYAVRQGATPADVKRRLWRLSQKARAKNG